MSVEAHRCNAKDCNGHVVFDNADFDFNNFDTSDKGFYMFDDPCCNKCGKKYYVVPHYIVIDVKDYDCGEFEELESACITEVDRNL
ncbi:hypothetical protein [Metabacillus sp. Hm71]|uniref:hypothetical protein n=1 Tax=Metabacillus sp. Hm71 TaxID=3450743 RepID=UPI003F43A761